MDTLVLASGNQKKLDEMRAILEPLALKVVPQSDFQVPEAEETGERRGEEFWGGKRLTFCTKLKYWTIRM